MANTFYLEATLTADPVNLPPGDHASLRIERCEIGDKEFHVLTSWERLDEEALIAFVSRDVFDCERGEGRLSRILPFYILSHCKTWDARF